MLAVSGYNGTLITWPCSFLNTCHSHLTFTGALASDVYVGKFVSEVRVHCQHLVNSVIRLMSLIVLFDRLEVSCASIYLCKLK